MNYSENESNYLRLAARANLAVLGRYSARGWSACKPSHPTHSSTAADDQCDPHNFDFTFCLFFNFLSQLSATNDRLYLSSNLEKLTSYGGPHILVYPSIFNPLIT